MTAKQRTKQIQDALSVFIEQGVIAELRVLNIDGAIVSGIFDDLKKMAEAASDNSDTGRVFFTMNPVKKSAKYKATNKLARTSSAVRDEDIEKRRWLLLDFDPVRPSNTPASEEEHEQALALAQECRDSLRNQGWPDPILTDSGNGAHLLYRVGMVNSDRCSSFVKDCLESLSLQFSNTRVRLDTKTFNASRLMRVPFTSNCKGEETEDRPFRLARLLEAPTTVQRISKEQLKALASRMPLTPDSPSKRFDLSKWFDRYGIPVAFTSEWNGGQKWILEQCPWNEEHKNKSAYVVQFANGGIAAGCLHRSCKEHNWPELRAQYEELGGGKIGDRRLTQSSQLIELVENDVRLFCTSQSESYATISLQGVSTVQPVNSEDFRRFLRYRHFTQTRTAPRPQAIQDAVLHFDTLARFEGLKESVFLRTANVGRLNYLDMCDQQGGAIAFGKDGWGTVESSPAKFRRGPGMLPLPIPAKGGNIEELRSFLNLQTDDDWLLFLAALVAALFSQGPFPILGLHGEAGSAKTTTARVFRKMVDPNIALSRGQPKDARDLMIAANNGWQLSFDNLSYLAPWFSDCLCRLSTGAGFSTRQLYTDSGEVLFEGQRPLVLNGIEELATRTDLIDRSILLELPVIRAYREEQKFWEQFGTAQPELLGALLEVAVQAIQELPNVKLTEQPRMADFAKLGTAIERALGLKNGTFLRVYNSNRQRANRVALDASPIANHICELAGQGWSGTATELLKVLDSASDDIRKSRSWPKAPRVLSGMLARLSTALRTEGFEVEFIRDGTRARNRLICLRKVKTTGKDTGVA